MEKWKLVMETVNDYLTENTVMTKREFWLTVTSCTLAGVLIGIIFSPVKKGLSIFSNNGNGNGCGSGNDYCDDQEDETECIGVYEK